MHRKVLYNVLSCPLINKRDRGGTLAVFSGIRPGACEAASWLSVSYFCLVVQSWRKVSRL
jgi:hypothetical protein